MSDQLWTIVIGVITGLIAALGFFMRFLFSWLRRRTEILEHKIESDAKEQRHQIVELRKEISRRLRTLGHEDRTLKGEISGVLRMLFDHIAGDTIDRRTEIRRRNDVHPKNER